MHQQQFPAPAPEAMLDKLGPILRETVFVEDRTYIIDHPAERHGLNGSADHPLMKRRVGARWRDLWLIRPK